MEPPLFSTTGPQILRAAPGSDASLVLPLPSGSPPFEFEWSRAGAKLDDRFTKSDDAGGVRLTISAARTGDSGVYTLQASNAAGKDSTRVRLEVSPDEMPTGEDPPTFLRRLQDLTVKVGTRTRFLVEIVSSTECRVTWYRNERRLLEAERIALVRDGNFWCADISAVSVDDAGRWTCTAENVGGRASCSAHLNVLVPKAYKRPEFVEELRALLTEQGTVSLECKVVGVPTPVLRWFKDSREIKAGDVFALTANAEDPTSLGTYTCEAVNCMGRAYSSSKVHVVGRASREGSSRPSSGGITPEPPPIFTKELEDQFVRICEPLNLSCHVVVPPWPRSVVWYNKEGKIEPSERYHVLEDGVGGYLLEVPTAEWPDEGEWKCVATSTGGRVGISTCYVSMDVPKNYRKPRFMENLQAVLTEEGLVSFECKVVGFPTPVLSWFKDGQELKPGDVYQLTGTNSLGSYCCIARNCMGQASSSAELTVEDIQNQLNEEEKLQLFSRNQAPKFLQGLKSVEAKIDEPFRFTIKVAIPPEPTVLWYRDDQPVDESSRCHHGKEERGVFFLDIQNLEFMDQAEWKCVAMNDFGHSVTSCFLKLIIPRHYKKPRFLENLQAILSDEGAVNLECKVIGVPQPVLKWYKDGEELKPGDIHRIISGQDGTCCLGTYTCEAQNCMGIAASSASLLGFEDSMKAKSKKKADEQALQRNLSLSTIHEERTSQMYDTPVGDMTLDEKGEISFSFDGKEVSVSLYETPDLTEEEALQIVEMYADQLSENVTEHNVVELPPLRFVKETSTSGNLLMEAIIIDVSPEYFTSPEEDLRTEADIEDISIADENGPPQLSLDIEPDGDDYLEKTIALLSDEKSDFPKKIDRKKSDSQRSADDYFSLSRDQSLSEEKKDDDTQILSESDLQSFASARSSGKPKSKSSKPSIEDGQESSDITKTVLLKEDLHNQANESDVSATKPKKQRRSSRSSRRSSSGSEKSLNKMKEDMTEIKMESGIILKNLDINKENIKEAMSSISSSLTEVINEIQILERDIILKSEFMSTAATASNSLEIINSLISPLSEIHSIADAIRETVNEPSENITPLLNNLPQSLENLQQSLTIIGKCIDVESDNRTLVKKTCMSIVRKCGDQLTNIIKDMNTTIYNECLLVEKAHLSNIETVTTDLISIINHSLDVVKSEENRKSEKDDIIQPETLESKHLHDTQKAIHELRGSLRSLLFIVEEVDITTATSFANIKTSEIILNDMSTPIQDLQTALEQIEILSVTETKSDLEKYNTEIIETAMESVLKLRTSFERLSTEASTMENKDALSEVLNAIKFNIKDISIYLDELEIKTGKFDILNSDNKLEALQKMAQILINLENNLPMLETVPNIKDHMTDFHKNLTKVLENVIESNDANKYFILLEICDAVNRMNTSIKSIDTNSWLSLTSINNTLKIIQTNVFNNVFQSELNSSLLSNIENTRLCIQETINKAEELSLDEVLENVKDLSIGNYEESKVNVVLENIEHTIIAISNVISNETIKEMSLKKVMENICPILVDLKYCIASLNITSTEKSEKISDIESSSFSQSIANPLMELHQNISVLNQVICENADSQELSQVLTDYAKPLLDLHHTLEILQHDVVSQYTENVPHIDISGSIANVVENLKSCIVMIQEQPIIEATDDMSTLEDISGIKTTADILPSDDFMTATAKEIEIVQFAEQILPSASSQALNTLNEHIMILQNSDILNILDPVQSCEYSALKLTLDGLEEIRVQIETILHPITMESCQELPCFLSFSRLVEIVPQLQEMQSNLSVIDVNTIPVIKNVIETNPENVNIIKENIQNFKCYLNDCLDVLLTAFEITDNALDISIKVNSLRQTLEKLNMSFSELEENILSNTEINAEITRLEEMVKIFLETTCFENTAQIKSAIENLYEVVVLLQDELTQFGNNMPELLLKDDTFIQTIHDVEKEIVSLEKSNFVSLCDNNNVRKEVAEIKVMEMPEESSNKENILKKYLTELVAPLDVISNQLLKEKEISGSKEVLQENATSGTNNKIETLDFKSAELQLSNISEHVKNMEQCLNFENVTINSDDTCVITNLNNSLHGILSSIEGMPMSESIKAICQSTEVIQNILHRIPISENVKEKPRSLKEKTETLLQHMEHYIEIIEIVEEVSAVIKLEDLKESANIVRELQQSIVTTQPVSEDSMEELLDGKKKEQQAEIVQRLHKALVSLQGQALENTQELPSSINEGIRQQIIEVVSDLQNDLIALTGTSVILEENIPTNIASESNEDNRTESAQIAPEVENKFVEIAKSHMDESKNGILLEAGQPIEHKELYDQVELSQIKDPNVVDEPHLSIQLNEGENDLLGEELIKEEFTQSKSKDVLSSKSEKLASINDILIKNIEEYISEKTMAVIAKLSPPLHSEHLEKTVEIAKRLWNNTVNESSPSEKDELESFSTEQIELVLSLNEAILIMYETTIAESQELETKVGKDELQAFKNIITNLRCTLQKIISNIKALPSFNEAEEVQLEETNIKEKIEFIIPAAPGIVWATAETISDSLKIENVKDLNSNITLNNLEEENLETDHSVYKTEDVSDKKVPINTTDLYAINKDLTIGQSSVNEDAKEVGITFEENKSLLKEELIKHISEYFCEETANIVCRLSTFFKSEDISQSIQIAHQLHDILSSDKKEIYNFSKEQLKLALLLEKAVSSLYELTVQESEDLKELVAKNELLKTNYIIKDLRHYLKTIIESTVMDSNLEILDFDDFRVFITKDPFNYEFIVSDNLPDTTLSKATNTESIIDSKDLKIPISTEVEMNDSLISPGELSLEMQAIREEIIVDMSEHKSSIQEKHVEVFSADLKENLQSEDFKEDSSSVMKLENLLKEVNDMIDISWDDNVEEIQNTLEEVQTIIMKLKSDFDGTIGDTINETLEDLECNVRSVQLQINEHSPPVLLKEVCVNLQVLVAQISEINEEEVMKPVNNKIKTNILDVCSEDVNQTIKSIEKVSCSEGAYELEHIISNLNKVKDTIKSLRLNFMTNAENLIMEGVEIIQNLDQVEEIIFCLEKDLESEKNIDSVTRDNILSAIHCVYGSLSNMRGTITSVQKRYMYENYGEPSRCFLVSIKNVMTIIKNDKKPSWKQFAKSLRKVLNHFEDIKFYINFDKTARLPSDAAFTKIILTELNSVLSESVLQNVSTLDSEVSNHVNESIKCINIRLNEIEQNTTLEVKEKIPIFKDLSKNMFELTEMIKVFVQNKVESDRSKTNENVCDLDHSLEPSSVDNDIILENEANKIVHAPDNVMKSASIELVEVSPTIIKDKDENLNLDEELNKLGTEDSVSLIDDQVINKCILQEIENTNFQSDEKQKTLNNVELKEENTVQINKCLSEKEFNSQSPDAMKTDAQLKITETENTAKEQENNITNITKTQINKGNEVTEQEQTIQTNQGSDREYYLEQEENKSFEIEEKLDKKPAGSEKVDVILNEQSVQSENITDDNTNELDKKVNFENNNAKTQEQQRETEHKKTELADENNKQQDIGEKYVTSKEEEFTQPTQSTERNNYEEDNTGQHYADQLIKEAEVDEGKHMETILNISKSSEQSTISLDTENRENINISAEESMTESNGEKQKEDLTIECDAGDKDKKEEKEILLKLQMSEDKNIIGQENLVSEEIKEEITIECDAGDKDKKEEKEILLKLQILEDKNIIGQDNLVIEEIKEELTIECDAGDKDKNEEKEVVLKLQISEDKNIIGQDNLVSKEIKEELTIKCDADDKDKKEEKDILLKLQISEDKNIIGKGNLVSEEIKEELTIECDTGDKHKKEEKEILLKLQISEDKNIIGQDNLVREEIKEELITEQIAITTEVINNQADIFESEKKTDGKKHEVQKPVSEEIETPKTSDCLALSTEKQPEFDNALNKSNNSEQQIRENVDENYDQIKKKDDQVECFIKKEEDRKNIEDDDSPKNEVTQKELIKIENSENEKFINVQNENLYDIESKTVELTKEKVGTLHQTDAEITLNKKVLGTKKQDEKDNEHKIQNDKEDVLKENEPKQIENDKNQNETVNTDVAIQFTINDHKVVDKIDDKNIQNDQNTIQETNNNILLSSIYQQDTETKSDFNKYEEKLLETKDVSKIDDSIKVDTIEHIQNVETQKRKREKKEIEIRAETKPENEKLIGEKTKDSEIKCEVITKDTDYSDTEEKIKEIEKNIKVETITSLKEMDQETSSLSISLTNKENADIKLVIDDLITVKENLVQVAFDTEDELCTKTTQVLEQNENLLKEDIYDKKLDAINDSNHKSPQSSERITIEEGSQKNLEINQSENKIENAKDIRDIENVPDRDSNNLEQLCKISDISPEIKQKVEESGNQDKETKIRVEVVDDKSLNSLIDNKHQMKLDNNTETNETEIKSASEGKEIHNEKDSEKQLNKIVAEKQVDILNVVEKQEEISLSSKPKAHVTENLQSEVSRLKDTEKLHKQNLKEEFLSQGKDDRNNEETLKKSISICEDEKSNVPEEFGLVTNKVISLQCTPADNQAETLDQKKNNEETYDNDQNNEHQKHKIEESPKSDTNDIMTMEKTNAAILNQSQIEVKGIDQKQLQPEEQSQVEAFKCEKQDVSNTEERKKSEKKPNKEKRRSKKSRETSKQTGADKEIEINSENVNRNMLDDKEKDVIDKNDTKTTQHKSQHEDIQNNLSKKDEPQNRFENVEQKSLNETEAQKIVLDAETHSNEEKLHREKNEKDTIQPHENKKENIYDKEDESIRQDSKKLKRKGKQKSTDEETRDILEQDQIIKVNKENKYVDNIEFQSEEKHIKNKKIQGIKECEKKEHIEKVPSIKKDKMNDRQESEQRKVDPVIADYTLTDYESEFPRPPGYIAKSPNIEDTVSQIQPNNKSQTIYKAQTLIHESQLRYSVPPHIEQGSNNVDGRSQIKERIKAASECRSTFSEKRTSSSRDTKRKPVFSTYLTDRTAVEGSRVKLTCSILSPTDTRITWYKNGVELENKHKFRSKFVDGLITLEILNAVPNDSGEYSCSIDNENGSVTSSANLKVYPSFEASPIPPTFTRSIRDNYHLAENELVLECRIRGQPLPVITWLKDDKPIDLSERYQAHYLADGVCRLTISSPTTEDSGKYTCKAENSVWSDQITHDVYFTGKKSRSSPNIATVEKMHFNRQAVESRRPHFTNVLSDHKVVTGGTIGLQVEIRGSPIRVEWLREGHSITEQYRNAQTYVDHGIYTLALSDVTEKESGLYTCRAYSNQGNVDMNASITVIQPNQYEGKPATIVSRPEKDVLISVGEDLNISFRVHGEPKAKVFFMKGIRDITNSQRVCKMTSDDYVKFTLKRTVVSDAGTYCIFARNAYGCDRAFVTVVIRQRASSDSLVSDWTYPMDDLAISSIERNYKSVPDRIPSEPSVVDGGNNWISLAWPKPDPQARAPILAYKVESWLLGKEGGARWIELGITPRNSFDAFNLKQGEEYHFRITPRNRYGWGESVQTSVPIGIGLAGDRPEFVEILPGQLKVLVGETAVLCCSFKGKPIPEIVWMKNGHEIEEEVGRVSLEINSFNTSLRIEEVKIDDEGRYSCEATNVHGRSSTYARVAVITDRQIWQADAKLKRERSAGVDGEYPPQFTMRLRDRRVQATYPVRLTCQVVGNPPPTLKWFKNEEEVLLGGRHTASQDEYFYTLEIAPTTLEDGGVYEAMARNGCGAVSCRCSLVVDKGIRAYIAPEFCCGLEPLYRLSEGEELRISAIVEAYPSVGVTWYRDGVRLRPSRRAIMTLDRDGQIELALAAVTSRDAGVYTCTASNEVGTASTSGKVEIVSGDHVIEKSSAPPIVISSDVPYSKEPMFIRKPRSSEAREGDTVIIECEVTGDPKPDVYWLRDFLKPDYYRDSSHFKRVGAGPAYRFEIPHAKLDYTGAYSIVAKNIHGETKAIISLQILAKDPTSGDDVHNIRFGRVEVIPRFDKELTDLLCYDGDAAEFECSVSGNPEPDIRWFHYNEIVPECLDFETLYDEGTARLKIKQVTAEDEGTYTCEASNSLGKASSSACLVVYPPGSPNTLSTRLRRPPALLSAASTPRSTPRATPARSLSRTPGPEPRRLCSPSREIAPKFYTYPYNRVAEEGDTVVFQCAVKGLPPPWATWDKDGIIITPSSRISIREKDEMFRILEIEQVTIEDVGLYRISLENDYGRAEASARLEVITQKGKFYGSTRSYSVSPRKTLPYRRRTPSFSKQD